MGVGWQVRLGCIRRWGGAGWEKAKKDCRGLLLPGVICAGKWVCWKRIKVRGPGRGVAGELGC